MDSVSMIWMLLWDHFVVFPLTTEASSKNNNFDFLDILVFDFQLLETVPAGDEVGSSWLATWYPPKPILN